MDAKSRYWVMSSQKLDNSRILVGGAADVEELLLIAVGSDSKRH